MSLPTVASLWVGPPLSWLEQLCLTSFADNGHEVVLYTYEDIANVPACVRVEDARAILPDKDIFVHDATGSPALYSDLFRFNMLEKTDHIWVDTDAYCNQPFVLPEHGHYHGFEKQRKGRANGGVLRLPTDSRTFRAMQDFVAEEYPIPPWYSPEEQDKLLAAKKRGRPVHASQLKWGVWGPEALTYFLQETGEIQYSQPEHVLYPVPFKNRGWFFLPRKRQDAEGCIQPDTASIHFWGRRFKPRAAEYGGIPLAGSFIESILEKHGIDPAPTARLMKTNAQREADRAAERAAKPAEIVVAPESVGPQLDAPKVCVVTCMKNEGPFILEWIAHHRAVGVTNFLIFTNDCSDGTDELLALLDDANILRHMPNPAVITNEDNFQPQALQYFHYHPYFRNADYLVSMDVDEFINVRTGDGTLADLFRATGSFHALSAPMVDFSGKDVEAFEDRWVTEQFSDHTNLRPGQWKSRRGVKTIVRNGKHLQRIRNHRPDMHVNGPELIWLDGSGKHAPAEFVTDQSENGYDCRGRSDLVVFNHYAVRSLDSYLVKVDRGDVVMRDREFLPGYWRRRNLGGYSELDLSRIRAAALAEYEKLLALPGVAKAHEKCCDLHREKIAELNRRPEMVAMRETLLDMAKEL